MNRTIAFTNRKGGCGKTTTTVNVAAALAHMGKTTLVVDLDPQAHATMSFGIEQGRIRYDVGSVARGQVEARDVLKDTYVPRLRVLPSSRRLSDFERRFGNSMEARFWLSERIRPILPDFDFVCFDTPPTTQLLTLSALVAAREAFIPMQAHFLAVEGMIEIVELVEQVRTHHNPRLEVCGIIPTFLEPESEHSRQLVRELSERLGEQVFLPPVHTNHALAEAPGFGRTIFQHELRGDAALDYYRVAQYILKHPPRGERSDGRVGTARGHRRRG